MANDSVFVFGQKLKGLRVSPSVKVDRDADKWVKN